MGAPELPDDPGEDDLRDAIHSVQHHPVLLNEENSDNETMDYYGYEPLAMGDDIEFDTGMNHSLGYNEEEEQYATDTTQDNEHEVSGVVPSGTNLPAIESADIEIERQVWSEPRPQELQLEMDNTRTAQILSAMAGFTLPNVAVPEWAAGVPEESWKEELLQRIRQRKESPALQTRLDITQ